MKKHKILSRCYLSGYILWLFGTFLAAMMWIKYSVAATWVFAILALIGLAGIIVSRVFYEVKRDLYPIVSFAGFGLSTLIEIIGFILAMVNIGSGAPAIYGNVMLSVCFAGWLLCDVFLYFANMKVWKANKAAKQAPEAK